MRPGPPVPWWRPLPQSSSLRSRPSGSGNCPDSRELAERFPSRSASVPWASSPPESRESLFDLWAPRHGLRPRAPLGYGGNRAESQSAWTEETVNPWNGRRPASFSRRSRALSKPVLLDLLLQRDSRDTQRPRGTRDVAPVLLKGLLHETDLERGPRITKVGALAGHLGRVLQMLARRGPLHVFSDPFREQRRRDALAIRCERHRAANFVL